ncbi:MAG TPA: sulfur carrier protein ThiS [Mycobacteriales bacterium]|nr:sulfur carrier protein ThiS [Mycobacteriales bacterium]
MTILLNGVEHRLAAGTPVAAVVAGLGAPAAGTAVALNGEVLPRAAWAATALAAGDRVEVLTAVQGG